MKLMIALMIFLSMSFAHAEATPHFDLKAISDLSDEADLVWHQLVQEKGSSQRALQAIKSGKEPSVRMIHEHLIQMIESSQFDNEGAWLKYLSSYGPEYSAVIQKPASPLLRLAARHISMVVGKILYKEIDSFVTFVPTEIVIRELYRCSLQPCADRPFSLNPQKRIPNFNAKMKRLGRVFFYASKIATMDYDRPGSFSCANYLDFRWAMSSLESLSQSLVLYNTMAIENEQHAIRFECQLQKAAGFDQFLPTAESVKEADKIALEYLKTFRGSL